MGITNEVINKGINYIIDHLDEEINVEKVASYCNFSKYYFNRLFKGETGESIYSFIKRLRLEKSAYEMGTDRDKTITEIGLKYGYSSSNFSCAFKKHHNISPIEFENLIKEKALKINPFSNDLIKYESFKYYDKRIRIVQFEDMYVLYDRHIGNYTDMKGKWDIFIDKYKNLITKDTLFIETCYEDPSITDPDRCIYDICMTINSKDELSNTMTLKGGRFAVYFFNGQNTKIFETYRGIFNIWLPNVKYKIDDRIGFDIYKSVDCNTNRLVMDLCIPIK